eukprot:CAMPEP_0185032872 /NCGR_PEP_ID=MMETSP1103-20130426/21368_1 /TAXON_ID=36769 /ORGANISM="Paraphysomonas bandaiensis, Strain Caron Lab Isolate" /LENGTH=701 /DNA_ID=CAMNT_0027568937 /DNA_START=35 /DNA_END=2137 /DNA_ORIENTATION=+
MTDRIGQVWQEGEILASRGQIHDALMCFQQAKALLLVESKKNYETKGLSQSGARIPQILGEILMKLNQSVDKNVAVLSKNPVLSLQLRPGFTKKDVKRAYKQAALKYHPDKNKDRDTSCIFAVVQAAYEVLLATAPSDPPARTASAMGTTPSHLHSSFRRPSSSRGAVDPIHSTKRPPETNDESKEKQQPKQKTHQEASGIAHMSSDELRAALRKIGFDRLERATREELIKKYLAAKSHFGGHDTSADAGAGWRARMNDELREKRQRERETSSRKKQAKESEAGHSSADRNRHERVQRMKLELPRMSITELRRMTNICGISTAGFIEKQDLLSALCAHYGIAIGDLVFPKENLEKSNASPCTSKNAESSKPTDPGPIRPNERVSLDKLRRVMQASGCTSRESISNRGELPKTQVTSASNDVPPTGRSKCRPCAGNVWTRERLKDMERKLRGNRLKRNPTRSKPVTVDEDETHIDRMLAEEEKKFQKFEGVGATATGVRTALSPVFPGAVLESDSDDDEIQWVSQQAPSGKSISINGEDVSNKSPKSRSPLDEELFNSIYIPTGGLNLNVDDISSNGETNSDSDDDESEFGNPDISPEQLKAMRLRRFESKLYKSSVNEADGTETWTKKEDQFDNSIDVTSFLSTLNINKPLHVGVALLSDDDDDEDIDDGANVPLKRSSHNSSRPSLVRPLDNCSPSATAW